MTTTRKFRWSSVALLAAGLCILAFAYRDRPSPQKVEVGAEEAARAGWESVIPPETSFVLDVAGAAPQLDELREDERGEQIADWTTYGVLLHAGLSAEDIRAAMYDKVPLRHAALEETANFDYGPGRRVILKDGLVWLFYSDFDSERRSAVLGRLADQVRMELGTRPSRLCVFRYRSDLMRGMIQVHREPDVPVEMAFSERFGYLEKDIQSRTDFEGWLSAVDDLVHVELLPGGGVRLGGRRFPEARTQGVTLEDIAALYQAHRRIAEQMEAANQAIIAASKPLADAFKSLVDTYNSSLRSATSYSWQKPLSLDTQLREVERLLADTRTLTPRPSGFRARSMSNLLPDTQTTNQEIRRFLESPEPNLNPRSSTFPGLDGDAFATGLGRSPEDYRRRIESLDPRVSSRVEELQKEKFAMLHQEGRIPPSEPGFSLDPQWDTKGLVKDLELLFKDPQSLVRMAKKIADLAESEDYGEKAMPLRVSAAQDLTEVVEAEKSDWRLREGDEARLRKIVDAVRGKGGKELEDGDILPFLMLKDELKKSGERENATLLAILQFLDSQHRAQCARYDGPLRGTRVGMVLFYTDLLAKLWASVDYYGQAPTGDVFGFLSGPRIASRLEPEYWDETWKLPNTRLWFGVRKDGYSSVAEGQLSFSHVSARVYSAGSNPLNPGQETTTSERARRVFGWWDRHFEQVADYEQMYHVQNQIMKWSVATGVLFEKKVCAFLNEVEVTRTHRFDRWYTEVEGLRFRRPLPFRPESEWFNGNETLAIIRSYLFPAAGYSSTFIEGGVSLGSAKSVKEGSRITQRLQLSLRRGGVDYSSSSATGLKSLKGSRFELRLPDDAGRLVTSLQPAKTSRLRSGPTSFRVQEFSTSVASKAGVEEVSLQSNAGELGRLVSQRIPGGSRLDWLRGRLGNDHRLASDVLSEFRFSKADEAATSLAGREKFLPDKGAYLVSDENGFEAVLTPASGSSGGAGGQPPWRVIRIAEGQPPEPNGWFSLSGVRQAGLEDATAIFGGEQRIVRAAEEPLQAGFASCPRLNSTPWQRLRPLAGEPTSTRPGRLERLFTATEPPTDATPVAIEASGPGVKNLEGFVGDGALFVKRPAGTNPEAFNDLVTSERITGKAVHEIIAQAKSGALPPKVRLGAQAKRDHGIEAARAAGAGDMRTALSQMHTAAKQGHFDEAVRSFRQQVQEDGLARLTAGELNPTARRLLDVSATSDAPDAFLSEATQSLAMGNLDLAVDVAKKAAQSGNLTGDAARPLDAIARGKGQAAMADYLAVKRGAFGEIPTALSERVDLLAEGRAVRTVFSYDGMLPSRRLDSADIQRTMLEGASIYAEDSGLLSKLDWDSAPGYTLHKLISDPRVAWTELSLDEFRTFRPTQIVAEQKSYVLRQDTSAKARTSSSPKDTRQGLSKALILRPAGTNAVSQSTSLTE